MKKQSNLSRLLSYAGVYTAGAYDINGSAAINVKELVYLGWVVQRDTSATVVTR